MNRNDLSLEEAFAWLLNRPYFWRKTGRPMAQRRAFLHKLTSGVGISLETKKELLASAGFWIQQTEVWRSPDQKR